MRAVCAVISIWFACLGAVLVGGAVGYGPLTPEGIPALIGLLVTYLGGIVGGWAVMS